MSYFDSPYCLSVFDRKAGRPSADGVTDVSKYDRLTEAQNTVVGLLAAINPRALYQTGAYPQLLTTDNTIFTFGLDTDGNPVFPIGKVGIYPDLSSVPDDPWIEGFDYYSEGTQIRIPNGVTWASPLYWRGIAPPGRLDASNPPILYPVAARELIVIEAVKQFAQENARNQALTDEMQDQWDRAWSKWCLAWRTQFRAGGALGTWSGQQLAIMGQYGVGD